MEEEAANLFCLYVDHEPINFKEAVTKDCWKFTMEEEMMAIKWVYKIKRNADGYTKLESNGYTKLSEMLMVALLATKQD